MRLYHTRIRIPFSCWTQVNFFLQSLQLYMYLRVSECAFTLPVPQKRVLWKMLNWTLFLEHFYCFLFFFQQNWTIMEREWVDGTQPIHLISMMYVRGKGAVQSSYFCISKQKKSTRTSTSQITFSVSFMIPIFYSFVTY